MKKTLMSAASLLFALQVQADCKLLDLKGDWVAYQNEVLVNPHTGVCHINVKRSGKVSGECDFSVGFKGPFTGTATVSKNCAVNLSMDFNPAPFISTFQLQLHKDKKSFIGRWTNTFGAIGTTSGVKR